METVKCCILSVIMSSSFFFLLRFDNEVTGITGAHLFHSPEHINIMGIVYEAIYFHLFNRLKHCSINWMCFLSLYFLQVERLLCRNPP